MSIREFHSQLVAGNNKNPLFAALRQLSTLSNPKSLFNETTANDWPLWTDGVAQPAVTPA
jgi:hypothetical protein